MTRHQAPPCGAGGAADPETSGSGGTLRTTNTAKADGCFRFLFPGTATTGPATAAGDFVDVG
ncbi:hypothetical protein ACWDGI_15895 [Streptomyces sp. NPDC001220]